MSQIASSWRRQSHAPDIVRSKVKDNKIHPQDQKRWQTAHGKLQTVSQSGNQPYLITHHHTAQFDYNSYDSRNNCHTDEKNQDIPYFSPANISKTKSNNEDYTTSTASLSLVSSHRSYSLKRSSVCSLPSKEGNSASTTSETFAAFDSGRYKDTIEDDHKDYCQMILAQNGKLIKLQNNIEKQKTELCWNHLHSSSCKHGKNCIFAHSKKELRLSKLLERGEKGLIDDVGTFMTKPCYHFVTTGSCPFGKRCSSIHDPRITGGSKSWLPYCTLANSDKIQTSVHVEWYGHATYSTIHHGHPFGPMFPLPMSSISSSDFLAVIANKKEVVAASATQDEFRLPRLIERDDKKSAVGVQLLNDRQRFFIANKMRHGYSDLHRYKFRPSHIIFDEICMVVQTRAFSVSSFEGGHCLLSGEINDYRNQGHFDDDPKEISLQDFNAENENHVIVREIAFGPILSPSDRHLALFFDICDKDVYPLSTDQQNKCRRMVNYKLRKKLLSAESLLRHSGSCTMADSKYHVGSFSSKSATTNWTTIMLPQGQSTIRRSLPVSFDDDNVLMNRPFKVCIPKDEICYNFVTELLERSYENFSSLNMMIESDKKRFESLVKHYSMFHLPVNIGRELTDRNTPVPKTDSLYNVLSPTALGDFNHVYPSREISWQDSCKAHIWKSFVETAAAGFPQDDDCNAALKKIGSKNKKCRVFEQFHLHHQSSTTKTGTDREPAFTPTTGGKDLPHICQYMQRRELTDNQDSMYFKEALPYKDHHGNVTRKTTWSDVKLYYDALKMDGGKGRKRSKK